MSSFFSDIFLSTKISIFYSLFVFCWYLFFVYLQKIFIVVNRFIDIANYPFIIPNIFVFVQNFQFRNHFNLVSLFIMNYSPCPMFTTYRYSYILKRFLKEYIINHVGKDEAVVQVNHPCRGHKIEFNCKISSNCRFRLLFDCCLSVGMKPIMF